MAASRVAVVICAGIWNGPIGKRGSIAVSLLGSERRLFAVDALRQLAGTKNALHFGCYVASAQYYFGGSSWLEPRSEESFGNGSPQRKWLNQSRLACITARLDFGLVMP